MTTPTPSSRAQAQPLRVALFTDSFHPELGGIQDSILACARELGARGHRVLVFAPTASKRDYARVGLPVAEPDLGPTVEVRRVASLPVPSSSQQSRLALPCGACLRDVQRLRPHLVHSHTFLSVGRAGLRAARHAGVPLLGTNHWAVEAFDLYAPLARAAFRRIALGAVTRYYQRCDRVTGPSRFTVEHMQRHGVRRPCSVISNPVDTRCFAPLDEAARLNAKLRFGLGAQTVVYAGRLAREKNLDVLLRGFALLREQLPQATLVLAGHGSAREALESLASDIGIAHAVRFVGTLPHAQLAQLFGACEVFAIASKSETQSMVVLQAMACGLPAVGARCGGLVEHIPQQAGLLVEPDDPADLRDKLLRLLADPGERLRLGAGARRFACGFSVAAVADAWEDLYRRTLAEADPREPRPL
jgi:glycosyltransferase involved in cell wall biosynthesis